MLVEIPKVLLLGDVAVVFAGWCSLFSSILADLGGIEPYRHEIAHLWLQISNIKWYNDRFDKNAQQSWLRTGRKIREKCYYMGQHKPNDYNTYNLYHMR